MNLSETVKIIEQARALWPDRLRNLPDATPGYWHETLADVSYPDAHAALTAMAREHEWFSLASLVAAVRQTRADRLAAVCPNPGDIEEVAGGDLEAGRLEVRAVREAIASGRMDAAAYRAYLAAGAPIAARVIEAGRG